MKRTLFLVALFLVVLVVPSVVFAQRLRMTINDPQFKPYPIAIPSLGGQQMGLHKAVAEELTDILRADIEYSPYFLLLNPKSYLAQEDLHKEPRFQDWINVGASGLIRAEIMITGAEIKAEFHFYDVAAKQDVFKKTYTQTRAQLRILAHTFANDLVRFFTGEEGVYFTQIAFSVRNGPGKGSDLMLIDFDGFSPTRIIKNNNINVLPAWDKVQKRLFFTSFIHNNADLYSVLLGSSDLKPVSTQHGLNTGAAVSPDGSKIALTLSKDGNSEIYVMNREGTNLKRLTDSFWIDTSPAWSPDGSQIAFVSNKSGHPHIYVMNADGSNQRRLTFQGNYNQTPDWSPKGQEIAFTARDERSRFDIFTVNIETQEIKRLTQDQGNNEEPSYSPDGRHIVFSSTRSGGRKIYVMNADGTKQRLVYDGALDCETPSWSPYYKVKP